MSLLWYEKKRFEEDLGCEIFVGRVKNNGFVARFAILEDKI